MVPYSCCHSLQFELHDYRWLWTSFNRYFTFFKIETLLKWSLSSLSDVKRAQRSTFQSSYVQVAVNFRFINPSTCTSLFSWPLPSTIVVASLKYFPMNFLERWQHVHDRFMEVAGLSTEMYTWKFEKSTHVLEQNAHDPFTENALFRLVTEFSRKSLIGENKIYSFKDKWRDSKK